MTKCSDCGAHQNGPEEDEVPELRVNHSAMDSHASQTGTDNNGLMRYSPHPCAPAICFHEQPSRPAIDRGNSRTLVPIACCSPAPMAESFGAGLKTATEVMMTPTDHPAILTPAEVLAPVQRPSRKRQAVAFLIAAVSDFLSIWTEIAPPIQWVIDLGTALLLFLILGRRWAILPGLIAEAIPGMGVFPVWVLVVLSIIVYDDIKGRKH
jgi:hypothetical protein